MSDICEATPCQNDGTCTAQGSPGKFTCECHNSYSGDTCQFRFVHLLPFSGLSCLTSSSNSSILLGNHNKKEIINKEQGIIVNQKWPIKF